MEAPSAASPSSPPVVGANAGGQCGARSEAAGAAAPGGRTSAQRDGPVAEHAEVDLQSPPPVLPPQSVLPKELTQAGTNCQPTGGSTGHSGPLC